MGKNNILVTKTFVPPLAEYIPYLKKIWGNRWLTNNGPFARELEQKIQELCNVQYVSFVNNGTMAIQLALRAMNIQGEVITTPFTFAATTTAIIWENCKPVFVDIDPHTFCIDPSKIEAAITEKTQAILPVHVYGYPCDVDAIRKIANRHHIKVIYDAAHAFNVNINGESILKYGDVSTVSLHATKLFHSGEGGLIVTNNKKIAARIERLKNFGYGEETIVEAGINAKNSEIHAALGLVNLKHISAIVSQRKVLSSLYKQLLKDTGIHTYQYQDTVEYNSAYFPVTFKNEEELLRVKNNLETKKIYARRYFYPSLNTLAFVNYLPCPYSESLAKRVLCLPLYHDLTTRDIKRIVNIIKRSISTLPSLTVGIPAYNEQANIVKLIQNILSQKRECFILREIIINSDGSTDQTVSLVRDFAQTVPEIKIIENHIQKGKLFRLNEIYSLSKSNFLLTLDADVLLKHDSVIDHMMSVVNIDNRALVVGANLIPTVPNSIIGKMMYTNSILWNKIRQDVNHGDHIANLYGSATLLNGNFAKTIQYPVGITCDEEYLYIKAKEKEGFRFKKEAEVLFSPPSNLSEALLQARRFSRERNGLTKYFGGDVIKLHDISLSIKIRHIIHMLVSEPLFTSLAMIFNLVSRVIPINDELNEKGLWKMAESTKVVIPINVDNTIL